MERNKVIQVDVRNPFDPNATDEQWAEVGRRIVEVARSFESGTPATNPFPDGGCVVLPS